MVDNVVSPTGRKSLIWNYFGFSNDSSGKICKEKAICKLCGQKFSHGGGTTNLRNHLKSGHLPEYNKLYVETASEQSSSTQTCLDEFMAPPPSKKFSADSTKAKNLANAVSEFIVRDLRPINVVDGVGFLNLMHVAEPRYSVPCRRTMMGIIDSRYSNVRKSVCGTVALHDDFCLTTDMWTSRPGDGYISLTAQYMSDRFVMEHKTLHCLHLPGIHDHTAIADVLKDCAEGYHIDLSRNVTAFTTDNGSNVVKAIEEDLNCLRIPCAGHTLNLSVSAGLEVDAIKAAIG